MFGDAQSNHFLGGIFLFLFSIIFIILFGIFSTNCDNTVCTIPATTMLQLTNIRYAIWIPISLLLVLGVYMIAGVRNNKLMITNKTVIGLWCNIFPIISLTLLVSSCLLYSIINADGFNCGDATPSKSSKIAYSDLHVSLFHYVTGMITMSSVLFCISVYTLYDFWRETDEQKIEKAKNAISQFDKIKTLSPGGSPKPDIKNDLTKLKKALEEGATINKDNDLEYYNKITEIEDYLVKSDALKEAKEKAIRDIEMSKLVKNSEQQSKSLSAITARRLVEQFNTMKDDDKINEICKYAKSSTPEDKYIYEELQKTPFYKQNTKKIVATCSGTLDEYTETLAQEQLVKKYYNEFELAFKRKDPVDILGSLETICELRIKDSYRTQIFEKIIEHYGNSIRNLGIEPTRLCAPGGPPGNSKRQLTLLIEQLRARTDKPSPQSPQSPPPVQASPGQVPPVQASPVQVPSAQASPGQKYPIQESSGQSYPPLKNVDKIDTGLQPGTVKPSFTEEDTKCVTFSTGVKLSKDPKKFICNTLDDEDNTGMSNEDILECLRKNSLTKENSLGGLRSNCLFSDEISDAPAETKKIGKPPMDLWGGDKSSTADLGKPKRGVFFTDEPLKGEELDPFGNPVKLPGDLFRAKKQGKKDKNIKR